MEYIARNPPPPLDAFVKRIWYCSDAPPHTRERVLPGGTLDLIINLAEDEIRTYGPENSAQASRHSGAILRGTSTHGYWIDPRQRASVVGVHFRPGGAFPFLNISPAEIVNAHVPVHDLWGSGARSLRERLLEAGSASERFGILEAALLLKLRNARTGHPAVRAAIEAFRGPDARVAEVASHVGLSHRGFVDAFKREVGLTPKFYTRLLRFHRTKERIARLKGPPSWATFAIDCGYFDQSHMIRDFVEFSGISPTSYLEHRSSETQFDHLIHAYRDPTSRERPRRSTE